MVATSRAQAVDGRRCRPPTCEVKATFSSERRGWPAGIGSGCGDVQSGGRQLARLQGGDQGVGIDQRAARDVQQDGPLFEFGQPLGVDHFAGCAVEGMCSVTMSDFSNTSSSVAGWQPKPRMSEASSCRIESRNLAAKTFQPMDDRPADPPQADLAHRKLAQRDHRTEGASQPPLARSNVIRPRHDLPRHAPTARPACDRPLRRCNSPECCKPECHARFAAGKSTLSTPMP